MEKIRDGLGSMFLYIFAIIFFIIIYIFGLTIWAFGSILGLLISILYKREDQ